MTLPGKSGMFEGPFLFIFALFYYGLYLSDFRFYNCDRMAYHVVLSLCVALLFVCVPLHVSTTTNSNGLLDTSLYFNFSTTLIGL
jgi:hypothetical protein